MSSSPPAQIELDVVTPRTPRLPTNPISPAQHSTSPPITPSSEPPPVTEGQPLEVNDRDPPIPSYESASALYPNPPLDTPSLDADFLQYRLAHDTAAIPLAPRRPEHRSPRSLFSPAGQSQDALPPYQVDNPPNYSRTHGEGDLKEPKTLARKLFIFGCFFPPFWVFGALMLITPFRSPNPFTQRVSSATGGWVMDPAISAWCEEHLRTDADKEAFLAHMHLVEMKWAKRCFVAVGLLFCFAVAIGVTVFAVLKVTE